MDGATQYAVKLGLKNIPKIDTVSDLDLMLDDSVSDGQNLNALYGMSKHEIAAGYSRIKNENDIDSDSEWKMSRRGFDAIQKMQDKFNDKEVRH